MSALEPKDDKVLLPMDEESRRSLQQWCIDVYLDGECLEFALAAHEVTGWPCAILEANKQWRHAVVLPEEAQTFFDARGIIRSWRETLEPFSERNLEWRITKPDYLKSLRPINARGVERARQWIEVLWPDLPRQEGSHRTHVEVFVKELTELCKRQGYWLRSADPGVLFEWLADELSHYTARPDIMGGYFLERVFKRGGNNDT